MAKSKPFRAFVEGQTISDGREITADMINDIVATFNTDTYTPRVNIEHISGYSPEPPFNAYGDVVGVSAQDDDITIAGKTEKRRALYAVVDGLPQLVDLRKKGQKPFPSVEITPSYAGAGKTGLVGLAFTDCPASIGTQPLLFSRAAVTGTLFVAGADAVDIDFEADPADDATKTLKAFFASLLPKREEPKAPVAVPPIIDSGSAFMATQFAEGMTAIQALLEAKFGQSKAATDALATRFNTLEGKLALTEAGTQRRTLAPGGSGGMVTDC